MRAVKFYGVGDLRVEAVPAPMLAGPLDVRLRVLAAGIGSAELHNFNTGQWVSKLPVIPGHEFAGRVMETADPRFIPGEMVVADSRAFCGECAACAASRFNLCENLGHVGEACDGGFAEQVVLPSHNLHHLPIGIPPEIGLFSVPLAVALHAIETLGPVLGQPVLVAGGGPIGGLVCLLLKEFGHFPLYLVERNTFRVQLLREVAGVEQVDLFRPGCPAFAHAIDASGSAAIVEALVKRIAPGGSLVLIGQFNGGLNIDLNRIVERGIKLRGCSVFEDQIPKILPLLTSLAPSLHRISSDPISLEEVPAAYKRLLDGATRSLKIIIHP